MPRAASVGWSWRAVKVVCSNGVRGVGIGLGLGLGLVLAFELSGVAAAQPVIIGPDANGITWCEVGNPGNVPARAEDYFLLEDSTGRREVGRVDRTFWMSRTELTVAQQFEFARAYTRVFPSSLGDEALGGGSLGVDNGEWGLVTALAPFASNMGFVYAMRYCNWLHNGRVESAEAFETGAYNVAEFGIHATREPGARFWMPSLDEWVKAMHYDPNRGGDGVGGYWLFPTMSDEVPVGGRPGTPGAQTGAGVWDREPGTEFPVGSYPDTMSAYGLLDGAGANAEWLDDPTGNEFRLVKGAGDQSREGLVLFGRLDSLRATLGDANLGLRIATVPTPGLASVLLALGVFATRRHR
jgi:hypothetical protein